MEKRIEEIYNQLPSSHQDLAFFAHHLTVALNNYKEERVKRKDLVRNEFFSSVHQCHELIIDELKRASKHTDEIESRYNDIVNIKRLQEFKETVPLVYKDIAIFCQELIKRFDDLKTKRLSDVGIKTLNEEEVDVKTEKNFLKVVEEVEREIMEELEKTYEDIKNTGKPEYIRHYKDGIR